LIKIILEGVFFKFSWRKLRGKFYSFYSWFFTRWTAFFILRSFDWQWWFNLVFWRYFRSTFLFRFWLFFWRNIRFFLQIL